MCIAALESALYRDTTDATSFLGSPDIAEVPEPPTPSPASRPASRTPRAGSITPGRGSILKRPAGQGEQGSPVQGVESSSEVDAGKLIVCYVFLTLKMYTCTTFKFCL